MSSITEELRDWLKDRMFMANEWQEIHDIADRIDAEHEAKVSYWQGASYEDGYDEGFASADDWLGQHEDAMAEHGWVCLPKDANGKYIHVGDVMEERSGHTFEVASLMAFGGSDNWLVLSDARNFSSFREPNDLRHYHAHTVEDVLRKCIGEAFDAQSMYVAESMGREEYERELDRLVEKASEAIRGLS